MVVSNQLRIIGGEWRGRKLRFADGEGLRPTTDRVRETVFNGLQGQIQGRRCLDLFAGSGALGLEALSRGAAEVVFWEKNPKAVQALRDNLAMLQCQRGQVVRGDTLQLLQGPARPFDVLFLDPPFGRELLQPSLELLASGGWLAAQAKVYIEHASRGEGFSVPAEWELLRSKQAGQVAYHLARTCINSRDDRSGY